MLAARVEVKDGVVTDVLLDVPTDEGKVGALARVGVMAPDAVFGNSVHDAASKALARLNQTAPVSVADSFYALAEKQYYGNSSVTSDTRNPMAFVWYWDATRGLFKIDVPHSIFNDIMTMRQTEQSLKAGPSQNAALSLWLPATAQEDRAASKQVLIVVGPSTHPPGTHEVAAGARLMKHCLENAENVRGIRADVVTAWPDDRQRLQKVATVVFTGDQFPPARMLDRDRIMADLTSMIDHGCGLVCVHYATGLAAGDVA